MISQLDLKKVFLALFSLRWSVLLLFGEEKTKTVGVFL